MLSSYISRLIVEGKKNHIQQLESYTSIYSFYIFQSWIAHINWHILISITEKHSYRSLQTDQITAWYMARQQALSVSMAGITNRQDWETAGSANGRCKMHQAIIHQTTHHGMWCPLHTYTTEMTIRFIHNFSVWDIKPAAHSIQENLFLKCTAN